ncbi:MAG TPA: SGNH/GDSL hydrolase family protein, partial [Daejeonella sp.]|nr:SGNH/GDSL hydrolase family protein [Daejeonella sp.]
GLNFINIGMSGSAKMDLPAEAMISGFNADAYILDCIPNVSAQNIRDRAYPFIMALRKQHPGVPIIVMESVVQEIEVFDQETDKSLKEQNKALVEVMTQLKKEKVPHLYFIKSTNLLGNDNEGTIDGSHPNDIGFFRMTAGLKKPIVKILKRYGIVGK